MQQTRDRLLETTAKAANVLLTVEDLDEAISTALHIIGAGVGCDFITVLENVFESPSRLPSYCHFIYEWAAPPTVSLTANLDSKLLPAEFIGLTFLEQYFLEGSGFGGLVADWHEPLRSWLTASQVQSAYTVPIRVNGQWWGVLCFDYCNAPVQISSAEVAILRTIADCIGSAIAHDRTRQEQQQAAQQRTADLEAYNQVLRGRDRLLEAAAKATNVLLTVENLDEGLNCALQIIGEGMGCDRFHIIENIFEPSSALPIRFRYIYEWSRPEFTRSITQLESAAIRSNQLEVAFIEQYFLNGVGFGGLLEVWPESLRNSPTADQVQSAYAVPIRVNGQWWGVLAFHYCREAIQISPAEVSVLMTIADCMGNAIQRDRNQKEREQAAQQRATELEEYNQRLLRRDQLLEVTARATNVLLTLDSIDLAINTALNILLEGTGCDRLKIMENIYDSSSLLPVRYTTIYKCRVPDFEFTHTDIEPAQAAELNGLFKKYFLEKDGFGGLLEEWDEPLRSLFATLQIHATYGVPIRVNGQWWGVLCLDYCRVAIQISPAEIAVLRTIADCIGSAIQRARTQKLILQSEQARVAELVKANDALKQSLDTFAADPDFDHFIGQTLRLIAQQFDSPLIEYWVYSEQPNQAYVHLTYWQGQIFTSEEKKQIPEMPPFLDMPLSIGNTNIGALSIYLSEHRRFSGQTIELAHTLAQQLTLAIELTRLAEEAQQAALLQERTRMAREIHDTLAQAFGGILMQLQAFTYFAPTQPDQAQTHLLTAQALAQEGLAEARRSVWTLYLEASEYEDLARAIAKFIHQTSAGQPIPIHLEIDGTPYSLHPDLGLNLLRIAQESIANALRHAQATTIQVHLSYRAKTLQLAIRDDGCGFDPQSPTYGFGLLGMQQRASRIGATWSLVSQVNQGTTIRVTLTNEPPPDISND